VIKVGGAVSAAADLDAVARGRGAAAIRGDAPGDRARRWPGDRSACAGANGNRDALHQRASPSPMRRPWRSRRWCSPARSGRTSSRPSTRSVRERIGLSGEDARRCWLRPRAGADGADLGYVGDVVQVNGEPIMAILDQGRIPVMASIGLGYDVMRTTSMPTPSPPRSRSRLNASKLILMTDVEGVCDASRQPDQRARRSARPRNCLAAGVIRDGMIPKVEAAIRATDGGCATPHHRCARAARPPPRAAHRARRGHPMLTRAGAA